MTSPAPHHVTPVRVLAVSAGLSLLLALSIVAAVSFGSSEVGPAAAWRALTGGPGSVDAGAAIVWRIRLPRALLAAVTGASLSLGGLVFQALLRNPLAEPYILGISGGSAIGAITGILLGLAHFPGVSLFAFAGALATLVLILAMGAGRSLFQRDALLLSGVMVNAFCAALIMFLLTLSQDGRLHSILFWLMGNLGTIGFGQLGLLGILVAPCFVAIFLLAHPMNLMLLGRELAASSGVPVRAVTVGLLVAASLMVSVTVSHCGLVGFVGLVVPHLLRMLFGSDHRLLVPACILGGGVFVVGCDLLARVLPEQGEMPAGVITAMIGAPLFIYLLRRSRQ
jgi:iron complex transport system permease protein